MSGTCSDCSYWGWYGKQRNFYPGQWVFSFARMTDDEWLLISAAEIVDVPADGYYATAVDWAYEEGITGGTSATTYSPNDPCTRGQMVTFLYRYLAE